LSGATAERLFAGDHSNATQFPLPLAPLLTDNCLPSVIILSIDDTQALLCPNSKFGTKIFAKDKELKGARDPWIHCVTGMPLCQVSLQVAD
jgi:hypothetical protein